MTKTKTSKDGFSIIGLGAAACVACCAGPILAFLGGLSIAGLASTWLIGATGLFIAAAFGSGFLLLRHRSRKPTCAVVSEGPVPVELSEAHPRSAASPSTRSAPGRIS